MEMQLKHVTKEELHKMIDEIPEEKLMVLTYKKDIFNILPIGKKHDMIIVPQLE